jgi:hypothetical protein
MLKGTSRWLFSVAMTLAAAGCGLVPDVIVENAKQSAKEEIEQKIDDLLADLGAQLDLSMFFPAGWDMDLNSQDEDEDDRSSVR